MGLEKNVGRHLTCQRLYREAYGSARHKRSQRFVLNDGMQVHNIWNRCFFSVEGKGRRHVQTRRSRDLYRDEAQRSPGPAGGSRASGAAWRGVLVRREKVLAGRAGAAEWSSGGDYA